MEFLQMLEEKYGSWHLEMISMLQKVNTDKIIH